MNKIILLVVVVVAAGLFFWFKPKVVPYWTLSLEPSRSAKEKKQKPCFGQENCIVAYVSPWCPHCERCIEAMQGLFPFTAIVGGDEPAKLTAMADRIGANAFLDTDGSTHRALGVSGVPGWYVLDAKGGVIASKGGAPVPCTAQNIKQMLGL